MPSRQNVKNITWRATIPPNKETSMFVIYETMIECKRGTNEHNEITLHHNYNDHGKKIAPVRIISEHSGDRFQYYFQISDKSIDQISSMPHEAQQKEKPDHSTLLDTAFKQVLEVKRSRSYIRVVAVGNAPTKIDVLINFKVHTVAKRQDWDHMKAAVSKKSSKILAADTLQPGQHRVLRA